jgi:nitroreductase
MNNDFETVKRYVVERRTQKVIASVERPIEFSSSGQETWNALVREAVAAAGMAPFHFERNVDQIPEPWRVHFLNTATCRKIAKQASQWFDIKPNNKIPGMLSACGCMLLVNWLSQFRGSDVQTEGISSQKQVEVDDEHLAATAAMVQNLLILLTSAGLGTYWSSGGFLGSSEMFRRLGIDEKERLLAAVFVEYPEGVGEVSERIPGKNRTIRNPVERWLSVRNLRGEDE